MYLSEISTAKVTFYHDYIVVSKEVLKSGSATHMKKEIMLQNQRKSYNGFMSPTTKRKVRTILTTWFTAIEHEHNNADIALMRYERRLTFATLTLSQPQFTTDKEIKRKMLNRMLIELQRYHGVKYFFWRAEKQKNGNIHFHLILDAYVSNRDLQQRWNEIQAQNGYMDKYFQKHQHYAAPSTEIHAISDTVNSINYVMKYVSKEPDDYEAKHLKVEGRIWGCSDELKRLKPYEVGEETSIGESLYQQAKTGKIKMFDHDHFAIFRVNVNRFLKTHCHTIYADMVRYYERLYQRLYNSKHAQVEKIVQLEHVKTVEQAQAEQLSLPFDLNYFDRSAESHHFD